MSINVKKRLVSILDLSRTDGRSFRNNGWPRSRSRWCWWWTSKRIENQKQVRKNSKQTKREIPEMNIQLERWRKNKVKILSIYSSLCSHFCTFSLLFNVQSFMCLNILAPFCSLNIKHLWPSFLFRFVDVARSFDFHRNTLICIHRREDTNDELFLSLLFCFFFSFVLFCPS